MGPMRLDREVLTPIPALQEKVQAYVAPKSQNILSLGQLCLEYGCRFVWESWEDCPHLLDSSGAEIEVWLPLRYLKS